MRIASFTALFISGLSVSTSSFADEPEDIVTYRQAVMGAMGRHMKSTAMIVKGEVDRRDDLQGHASAMHAISLYACTLFPESTKGLESEALPKIWEDPPKFEAACKKLHETTNALAEIASGDDFDATKAAFGAVGKSCGGCHDDFKVE
jgi:cytochrome c556